MEVELNGRKIDLSKAFPLIRRDWEALASLGATWESLAQATKDPKAAYAYATYVVLKADPSVPADDVGQLTGEQLISLLAEIRKTELAKGVAIPFSTTSTSSDAPTAGP